MPEAIPQQPTIGAYKGQPWILFDTVAAASFLIGDSSADGVAIGTNTPAISSAGEMIFFNAPGRSKANWPTLTNLDVPGQLAYGFEVWAIAIELKMPSAAVYDGTGPDQGIPQFQKLAEALMLHSVVDLNLGQEEQSAWPLSAFGNGGGLWTFGTQAQNSEPELTASLKLPEPIAMGRTQNLSCKIRIAPFMFDLIGRPVPGIPGVGRPAADYGLSNGEDPPTLLDQPPFAVQMKLIGRRIKQTQYGASPV